MTCNTKYRNIYSIVFAATINSQHFFYLHQLRFQPNDYQAVKDIADEITILAELDHPNLIKYYGVEVHRVRLACIIYLLCEKC